MRVAAEVVAKGGHGEEDAIVRAGRRSGFALARMGRATRPG